MRETGHPLPLFFTEQRPAAAPPAGRDVVFLHGFPENSDAWRHQLPALAAAGFRAISPDLRGYGRSPVPPRVSDYRIEHLAADVLHLIRHNCSGRAHLVGHDWGGVIAWWVAMHYPDAVERLVILNAPHPAAYRRELRRLRQLVRSGYILFFQLPWLPEWTIRRNDCALLRRLFKNDPARPGAYSESEIRRYAASASEIGRLNSALNYYRAALRRPPALLGEPFPPVLAPTLLLWGDRDRYLVPALADHLDPWVPNLRTHHFPHASHWLHRDEPQRVNALLVDFLREPPG